jgi:hypothetical protein
MAVVSAAIVLLVAGFALTASQSPPPAIAELSPDAAKKIEDAPKEQSSENGSADGGSGLGGGGASTTTTLPPGVVIGPDGKPVDTAPVQFQPRRRRCIGNPPRQTEDPQSPPCVPYWTGDNGGATSKGVTRDEIRVAVFNEEAGKAPVLYSAYFNKRYELYGRKLVLVPISPGGGCVGKAATATEIDGLNIFASIGMTNNNERCYFGELARRKIVGSTSQPAYKDDELGPYTWQYTMGYDRIQGGIGRWICDRLAGRPARFAEGVDASAPPQALTTKRRVFGLVTQTDGGNEAIDTRPLEAAMAACGEHITARYDFLPDASNNSDSSANANAIARLRTAGVTSVICMCVGTVLGPVATGQAWFPEWLISTIGYNDYNNFLRNFWPDDRQRANALGISVQPRQVAYESEPAVQAYIEAEGYNPRDNADAIWMLARQRFYHQLLLLVAGFQMAGPNLTPESFKAGLQRTPFPNPDHPNQAGKVGFNTPRDQSMTEDFVEYFWSPSAQSPYTDEGVGSICYIDGGRRRTAATGFPAGDAPFFTTPCDSGG